MLQNISVFLVTVLDQIQDVPNEVIFSENLRKNGYLWSQGGSVQSISGFPNAVEYGTIFRVTSLG